MIKVVARTLTPMEPMAFVVSLFSFVSGCVWAANEALCCAPIANRCTRHEPFLLLLPIESTFDAQSFNSNSTPDFDGYSSKPLLF